MENFIASVAWSFMAASGVWIWWPSIVIPLFHLPEIGYWQSWQLVMLSWCFSTPNFTKCDKE